MIMNFFKFSRIMNLPSLNKRCKMLSERRTNDSKPDELYRPKFENTPTPKCRRNSLTNTLPKFSDLQITLNLRLKEVLGKLNWINGKVTLKN